MSSSNGLSTWLNSGWTRTATMIVCMLASGEWALSQFENTVERALDKLESRIVLLEAEMTAKTLDRYHASDAIRDFALRDQELVDHERRIQTLENQRVK